MAIELERRFFISSVRDALQAAAMCTPRHIVQGYIAITDNAVVRVRIEDNFFAFITTKCRSRKVKGASDEFEYPIPLADAKAMLRHRVGELVEKTRWLIPEGDPALDLQWELDIFKKQNAGLAIAEIEVRSLRTQISKPSWLGAEIKPTSDLQRALRLSNAALARKPTHLWSYAELEEYLPQQMAITIWKKSKA